jgi:hypothetical protein
MKIERKKEARILRLADGDTHYSCAITIANLVPYTDKIYVGVLSAILGGSVTVMDYPNVVQMIRFASYSLVMS